MQVWVGGIPAVRAHLDRGMAVAAVDPEAADMMLVAEGHRLALRPPDPCQIARVHVPASNERGRKDRKREHNRGGPQPQVRRRAEDLGHALGTARQGRRRGLAGAAPAPTPHQGFFGDPD